MAFNIEMTVRGVLRAGNWRTEDQLNLMSSEDKRDYLIVVQPDDLVGQRLARIRRRFTA
jgi:hypothetical protein